MKSDSGGFEVAYGQKFDFSSVKFLGRFEAQIYCELNVLYSSLFCEYAKNAKIGIALDHDFEIKSMNTPVHVSRNKCRIKKMQSLG